MSISSLLSLLRTRLLFPLVALFAILAAPLHAHELRPAIADMSFGGGKATVSIALNAEALITGIGPKHDDTETAPEAQEYEALRAAEADAVESAFEAFKARFLDGLTMRADGEPVSVAVAALAVPGIGDTDLARESTLTLTADLPAETDAVAFGWAEDFGPLILRAPGESEDALFTAYLTEGAISEPISLAGAAPRSMTQTIADYIVLGFTHILPKGLDHILFVIGLFLLSARLGPLLWQVTAFTVAHTVTLALGITGTVSISPSIVEPLIAASIVWVCIENILSERMALWRPLVVFGFGLLHGLGFAGVLGEIGLPSGQFVTALLSFNVGVELGQLTVIAACLLAVGWFRNASWYRSVITIPASLVIAAVGAYWFVERVGLV